MGLIWRRKRRVDVFQTAMAIQRRGGLAHIRDCPSLTWEGHACTCGAVSAEWRRLEAEDPDSVPVRYRD